MNLYDSFNKVNATTAKEMAEQAKLDFTVSKKPLLYLDSNNNSIVIPDKVSIVRDDNDEYLGIVGIDYGIVQYEKMLDFTEVLVEDNAASYVCGYALGNGRQAIVVMKTPDNPCTLR